jgi:hypothetical protein
VHVSGRTSGDIGLVAVWVLYAYERIERVWVGERSSMDACCGGESDAEPWFRGSNTVVRVAREEKERALMLTGDQPTDSDVLFAGSAIESCLLSVPSARSVCVGSGSVTSER